MFEIQIHEIDLLVSKKRRRSERSWSERRSRSEEQFLRSRSEEVLVGEGAGLRRCWPERRCWIKSDLDVCVAGSDVASSSLRSLHAGRRSSRVVQELWSLRWRR